MKLRKDLFLMKITIRGMVRFFNISQDMSIFRPLFFVKLNEHKIIYQMRYKSSNFEKHGFLVTRKLRHREFG